MSMTATAEVEPSDEPAPPRPHLELFTQEQLEAHAARAGAAHRLAADRRAMRAVPLAHRGIGRQARGGLPASLDRGAAPAAGPSEDWLRDNYHVVQDQIPRGPPGPAEEVLPRAAQAGRRPVAGLSARLSRRPRAGRAYRRPSRSRDAGRLRQRLPARGAAVDRRDVGDSDHAAGRARRGVARGSSTASSPRAAAASRRGSGKRTWRRTHGDLEAGTFDRLLRAEPETAAACRRPSSSSCCSGCAISRRRRRRPGRRCSARSRRRATRPRSCCGVEHQREATDQLAIGNVITSMRLLSSIDWPLFFDRVSVVEQILRERSGRRVRADGFPDP